VVTVSAATAVTATFALPAAALTAPVRGSTLGGPSQTFTWTAGMGATEYWLSIGDSLGSAEHFQASAGMALSMVVTGLPTDGRLLYIRLWTL
jgi:hypothetical protein